MSFSIQAQIETEVFNFKKIFQELNLENIELTASFGAISAPITLAGNIPSDEVDD